jgi:choline dehydrogenase-like flavoprotein
MLPLTAAEKTSLHPARLPANLYVADATLLPRSLGNPPILTILALAKRVARAAMAAQAAAAERAGQATGQALTA